MKKPGSNTFKVFIAISFIFFGASFYAFNNQKQFIDKAQITSGKVIDLVAKRGSDSTTYAPRVEYFIGNKRFNYTSNVSSNPPGFNRGERVEIFFDPDNPSDVKINSFGQLWFFTIFLAIFGSVFFAIGYIPLYLRSKRNKKIEHLKRVGTRFNLKVTKVAKNKRYKINGKNPWLVFAKGVNPITGLEQEFKSENLWDRPDVNTGDSVEVLIDRANPKSYWINLDISTKSFKKRKVAA